jgi:hypothetical protein
VELEIRGAEFPTASIAIFRDESGCGIARRDCSDEDRTRLSRNNFGFHGALTEALWAQPRAKTFWRHPGRRLWK